MIWFPLLGNLEVMGVLVLVMMVLGSIVDIDFQDLRAIGKLFVISLLVKIGDFVIFEDSVCLHRMDDVGGLIAFKLLSALGDLETYANLTSLQDFHASGNLFPTVHLKTVVNLDANWGPG